MEGRPDELQSPRDYPLAAPESVVAETLAGLKPDD
jgi:hypothetical protein